MRCESITGKVLILGNKIIDGPFQCTRRATYIITRWGETYHYCWQHAEYLVGLADFESDSGITYSRLMK